MYTKDELFIWNRPNRPVNFIHNLDERNIKYDIFQEINETVDCI